MSGDYVCSFGERMKQFRRGKTNPPALRPPLWIRFRYSWSASGRSRVRSDPWIYCCWDGKLGDINNFVRGVVGSWNQCERLTKERPANLGASPFREVAGVKCYLEAL